MGDVDDFGGFLAGYDGKVEGVLDVVLAAYDDALVGTETGTGGDEVTADYVFLHALEVVDLAVDGCFVENLGGFLE